MAGLNDTSSSRWPLIADGAPAGVYATDESAAGGVWKGKKAICVRADISAAVETLLSTTHTIKRDDNPTIDALQVDATNGWLLTDSAFLAPQVTRQLVRAEVFQKRRFQRSAGTGFFCFYSTVESTEPSFSRVVSFVFAVTCFTDRMIAPPLMQVML